MPEVPDNIGIANDIGRKIPEPHQKYRAGEHAKEIISDEIIRDQVVDIEPEEDEKDPESEFQNVDNIKDNATVDSIKESIVDDNIQESDDNDLNSDDDDDILSVASDSKLVSESRFGRSRVGPKNYKTFSGIQERSKKKSVLKKEVHHLLAQVQEMTSEFLFNLTVSQGIQMRWSRSFEFNQIGIKKHCG